MTPGLQSPPRPPLPPSPSKSLVGMKKVIPPDGPHPVRTSSLSWSADLHKPLPDRPKRTSSVYSGDSGYTEIIQSYATWNVDEPTVPLPLQPIAYRQALSGLLSHRFADSPSPPSEADILRPSPSIRSLCLAPLDSPAISDVDSRDVPLFTEFSRRLKTKKSDVVSPVSRKGSPNFEPDSHETFWQPSSKISPYLQPSVYNYESEHLPGRMSPRIVDVVDASLVPPPLDLSRPKKTHEERKPSEIGGKRSSGSYMEDRLSDSRFSKTSSSDSSSFVIYTGVRESIRAMIQHQMQKNKKQKTSDKNEMEMTTPVQPSKNPVIDSEERFSRVNGRRTSLQQGVSSLLRKLSLSKSRENEAEVPRPRTRQKQLAIPISPYQKYGPAIWYAPKRQKKRKSGSPSGRPSRFKKTLASSESRNMRRPNHRYGAPLKSREVMNAFQNGTNQLVSALDETRLKITRKNSEKRREALKKSITLVGPADQFPDGRVNYWV